jgi:hypothetical protein
MRCKKGGKMPDLAFFGPKLYYKSAIKIDSAGIAVFAYYLLLIIIMKCRIWI